MREVCGLYRESAVAAQSIVHDGLVLAAAERTFNPELHLCRSLLCTRLGFAGCSVSRAALLASYIHFRSDFITAELEAMRSLMARPSSQAQRLLGRRNEYDTAALWRTQCIRRAAITIHPCSIADDNALPPSARHIPHSGNNLHILTLALRRLISSLSATHEAPS